MQAAVLPKEFLLSMKEGVPDWDLLGIPDVNELPAVQWKLQNIQKLAERKRKDLLARLKKALELGAVGAC